MIYGVLDCYAATVQGTYGNGSRARQCMKAWWDALNYFVSVGVCTRVAWYKGDGSAPGSDGPEGANPFGTNAWFLFRFPPTGGRTWPWYLHMQMSISPTAFGVTNHPALLAGSAGGYYEMVGVQIARGIGSTNSPWNGTTNNDGTDTKGTAPYWVVPSGGTRVGVLPRNNGVGGAYVATKQNFASIMNSDSDAPLRMHILTDGDGLVVLYSMDVGTVGYTLLYLGAVQSDVPDGSMFMASYALPLVCNAAIAAHIGGVDVAGQERSSLVDYGCNTGIFARASLSPSPLVNPQRYAEYSIPVLSMEGLTGIAGKINPDLLRLAWCLPSHLLDGTGTRAFFSNSGSTDNSLSISWSGAAPGCNNTRGGRVYVP